jgi:RNA polymerase sigma-70 factor (ECF subfamily)
MKDFLNIKVLSNEIKQGNSTAFEFLFKNYYPRLYGYAFRFIPDTDTVDDIVQECFIKLWEKHQNLNSESITSLLFAMVRNGCLNYLKHKDIEEKYQLEYLAKIGDEERLYYSDFAFDPEHKLLYDELQEQTKFVINNLPARCRQVFIMSRLKGMKNKEIATELQISTTAVEKHISKAIRIFADHFKNNYPVDVYIIALAWLIRDFF